MTTPSPPPPPPPPSPPPATGSWLPACSTVNVGSGYDLLAAAAAAPLSAAAVAAAASSSVPLSSDDSATTSAVAAAAAKKEAALNQMTGAEFLESIGLSPSFSPPPRRLPITNDNSNSTVAGASVCTNDVAYTAGPTASATVCEFINCYNIGGQRSCFLCSGTFVGDPSGAGRLIFLTGNFFYFFFFFFFLFFHFFSFFFVGWEEGVLFAPLCLSLSISLSFLSLSLSLSSLDIFFHFFSLDVTKKQNEKKKKNAKPATHCAAENANTALSLADSYVTCNRASGATDGIFRATGAAISLIDFTQGYGITDGAFILVAPQSNTNLGYAARLAIGAIKSSYFSTSVPNYSSGFPQVDTRLEGCTSANLGNVAALHYSRKNSARSLVSTGIQITGMPACGGNSGGPLVDENACVVYGVLSSTTVACSGGTNSNSWSRLSTTGGGGGVNVPGLSAALFSGAINFVS